MAGEAASPKEVIRAERPPAGGPPPRPKRSSVAGFVAKKDGGGINRLGRAAAAAESCSWRVKLLSREAPEAVGPIWAAFWRSAVAERWGDGGAVAKGRRSREEEGEKKVEVLREREREVGSRGVKSGSVGLREEEAAAEENKLANMLVAAPPSPPAVVALSPSLLPPARCCAGGGGARGRIGAAGSGSSASARTENAVTMRGKN